MEKVSVGRTIKKKTKDLCWSRTRYNEGQKEDTHPSRTFRVDDKRNVILEETQLNKKG